MNGNARAVQPQAHRLANGTVGAAVTTAKSLQTVGSLTDRLNRTALENLAQHDGMRREGGVDTPEADGQSPVSAASLRVLFEEQHRYLDAFFQRLDYEPIERFCAACLDCKGTILFTGVGKSGFIAQKISQTLVSTGTKAVFLNPTDALHGDIGIVGEADLLVAFSKSGGSEELLKLLPFAKAKGATLVSVTSMPGCKLEALCDLAVVLPLVRELCPFDLAPVTSTAIQMLFGDTVAIALMKAKQLTMDQYAANHPAGRIGKRLTLRVADLMLTGAALPVVPPEMHIIDVLTELSSKGQGCVLVAADGVGGALAGTFTDGDLRRSLQARGPQLLTTPVADVMACSPRTCAPGMKAVEAMQAMETPTKVTFLPVVEGGRLLGLISLHGLVSAGL